MGVSLSVDDFGTGYSSLAYLRRLPIDEIKIDKSFVLGMGTDLSDLAIVRAIVDLGHSLHLRVVAEGVEEEAARDALRDMGCDQAQGFLISRPMPLDRFEAWLQARTGQHLRPGVDHPCPADDELTSTLGRVRALVFVHSPCWGRVAQAVSGRVRPDPRALPRAVHAPLAQSAERLHGKEKVYGSIP